ncbi:hypothetical protein MKZ38_001672 [Zalerion maritima]|uniref:Uncharacterized protein n=1 Tax=Zalerion maritima TaxID=339359 RepID=A0AAD5RRD1_9PEZI|nr:hypothetical protein MKZ38_001672 [Zalerion maritima]
MTMGSNDNRHSLWQAHPRPKYAAASSHSSATTPTEASQEQQHPAPHPTPTTAYASPSTSSAASNSPPRLRRPLSTAAHERERAQDLRFQDFPAGFPMGDSGTVTSGSESEAGAFTHFVPGAAPSGAGILAAGLNITGGQRQARRPQIQGQTEPLEQYHFLNGYDLDGQSAGDSHGAPRSYRDGRGLVHSQVQGPRRGFTVEPTAGSGSFDIASASASEQEEEEEAQHLFHQYQYHRPSHHHRYHHDEEDLLSQYSSHRQRPPLEVALPTPYVALFFLAIIVFFLAFSCLLFGFCIDPPWSLLPLMGVAVVLALMGRAEERQRRWQTQTTLDGGGDGDSPALAAVHKMNGGSGRLCARVLGKIRHGAVRPIRARPDFRWLISVIVSLIPVAALSVVLAGVGNDAGVPIVSIDATKHAPVDGDDTIDDDVPRAAIVGAVTARSDQLAVAARVEVGSAEGAESVELQDLVVVGAEKHLRRPRAGYRNPAWKVAASSHTPDHQTTLARVQVPRQWTPLGLARPDDDVLEGCAVREDEHGVLLAGLGLLLAHGVSAGQVAVTGMAVEAEVAPEDAGRVVVTVVGAALPPPPLVVVVLAVEEEVVAVVVSPPSSQGTEALRVGHERSFEL